MRNTQGFPPDPKTGVNVKSRLICISQCVRDAKQGQRKIGVSIGLFLHHLANMMKRGKIRLFFTPFVRLSRGAAR